MPRTWSIALLAILLAPPAALAEPFLSLDEFDLDEIRMLGFELPRRARVEVEAVGLSARWSRSMAAYAWILDADTREPVWVLDEDHSKRARGDRLLREAQATLDLEAGRYELYTFAGTHWSWTSGDGHRFDLRGLGDLLHGRGRDGDRWSWSDRDLRRLLGDCHVRLSCDDLRAGDVRQFDPDGEIPGALVRHTRLSDEQYVRTAFSLDREVDLRIYALLEFPEDWDHPADNGWIVNARTGERAWEVTRWRDTKPAGGADKNRLFDGQVRLPAGDYVLHFGTDGSHSYDAFNAPPPYDPLNWGITLLPAGEADRSAFHLQEAPARAEPLVDLTKARDGDYLEQPFRLSRQTTLRVVCLGEYSHGDHEFADRGWIEKATGGDVVWEMTRRNTQHGGGAEKNRMFDDVVTLPAGDYVAYYVTDDSHAYRDWNSDPPYEPEAWGLALYPGPDFASGSLQKLVEADLGKNGDVLARIVHVGDRARRETEFKLDRPTRVRIYALGEGWRGEMYDYGYIVDTKTDDVVWEMTWRNTRHGGGARKNRIFDGEVLLDAGTYSVHYESDGSHSFASWNDSAPRDPRSWGITVRRAEQ
jgi:hypothetical protein